MNLNRVSSSIASPSRRASTDPSATQVTDIPVSSLCRSGCGQAEPDPAALRILDAAIASLSATLHAPRLTQSAAPVPPPELGQPCAVGTPGVADESFVGHVPVSERRSLLAVLRRDDGLPSDDAA
jgi:hypothetical protein